MSSTTSLESTTYRRLAFLLILIGLLFAVDSIFHLSIVYKFWPIVIALLGTGLIGIYVKRKARGPVYLAAGEYLILFSGLALYCNFTSWGKMIHLWPAFIAFLGLVFITLFFFYRGTRFLLLIGLLLLSLFIIFIVVSSLGSTFWWIVFILVGLSILISDSFK